MKWKNCAKGEKGRRILASQQKTLKPQLSSVLVQRFLVKLKSIVKLWAREFVSFEDFDNLSRSNNNGVPGIQNPRISAH